MQQFKRFIDGLRLRTQFFISGAITLCAAVSLAGFALYAIYGNARIADARSYARSLAPSIASMAAVRTRDVEDFFLERLRLEKSFFSPQAGFRFNDPLSSLLMRRSASQMAASVYYAQLRVQALYVENAMGGQLAFDRNGAPIPVEGVLAEAVTEARVSARLDWGSAQWRTLSDGTLSMQRAVFDIETTAYLGFFVVLTDSGFFQEMLSPLVQEYGAVILFDGKQEVFTIGTILQQDEPIAGNALPDHYRDTGAANRWTSVVLVSRTALDRSLGGARLAVAVIILLCIVLALAAAFFQSRRVTRGLSRLTASIKDLGTGKFDAVVPLGGGAEVIELGREFNLMTVRLEGMLADLARERAAKQEIELRSLEAEYRNLQAQLNPHFLYNALETINSTAKLDNSPRAAALTRALSVLLRGALSRDGDRVTLATESFYLDSYLLFAKTIHGDSLSIDMDMDRELEALWVPRFILQPLAENALRHAFPAGIKGASLVIRSDRDESGSVRLSVADNGQGIDEDRMRVIIHAMVEGPEDEGPAGQEGGVGLRNIHRRIRIRCGIPYGVELVSTPGKGTVVHILLPPGGIGDV